MHHRIALAALFVVACSPSPAPVSQSSKDPSSPSAPEGMNPTLALAAPHTGHAGHDHAATVYVCPMHPEVTSTKAGELCPKCNMKLVPKQP
jgi:hypothetical protein